MSEITIPTNRTNRSIRQSCTGPPLSLMRCDCPIDDRTCRIGSKLFHLTNGTNRSNRHAALCPLIAIEMQFSDRQQIECCLVGWNLFDSIGHEWSSGLMVCALASRLSGPGLSPGRGHCVVFLGMTLHFLSASHNASV